MCLRKVLLILLFCFLCISKSFAELVWSVKNEPDSIVCSEANHIKGNTNKYDYEVKRRGLDCGVKSSKKTNKICQEAVMKWINRCEGFFKSCSQKQANTHHDSSKQEREHKALLEKIINENIYCSNPSRELILKRLADYNKDGVKSSETIKITSKQTKDPAKRPLATVSDSTVCYNATTTSNGKKVWNDRNENFVGEANYRGLDCSVKDTNRMMLADKLSHKIQNNNTLPFTLQLKNIKKMSNDILCDYARYKIGDWRNYNYYWSKEQHYQNHVKEAKSRGLDCGVKDISKTVVASKPKIQTYTKPITSSAELDAEKQKRIALQKKADEEVRKRKELERRLAALEKLQKEQQQSKPKTVIAKKPQSEFPLKPITINFPSTSIKRDDIAVIIGNANYKKMGKDIPNVNPAYADAEGIKQYFMKAKGIREGNIIYLKDATNAQLLSVFGNEKSHKGKLFNFIKPNKSNVYIYYAGHGAPGEEGDSYLVPTDTDSQTIEFTGYPLSTLYSNLGKLPAKSMTVILEACFSGGSQSGSLISKASPIVIQAKKTMIPENIKVIAAGSERQMASWEEDSSHSLFTKYFLKAMSGEGDSNKDGNVSDNELKEYLSDTMTYYARRYYGRDQKVQIHNGG